MLPWLPQNVSTHGGEIDGIFYVILWITGIIFLVVEGGLLWFIFRYRHKEGRKAEYIHGNWKVEVVWTAIPFLIVIVLGAMSWGPWSAAKNPRHAPPDAVELAVHAKQFEWEFTYPGPDGELGTADDFQLRNQLHIPVHRPVRIHLSAEDVIHSFFLPHFRVKQDIVPGMEGQSVWFEATEPGEYVLACAELCGTGHTRMMGSVTVHPPGEFAAWQAESAGSN
jgi:cytochrome c oxidase subunit II